MLNIDKDALVKAQEYQIIGIRGTDIEYEIGEVLDTSYDWDFENDCSSYYTEPIELGGTCVTEIDVRPWRETEESLKDAIEATIKKHRQGYDYKYTYLVGAQRTVEGFPTDNGEAILEDAEIIGIIEL